MKPTIFATMLQKYLTQYLPMQRNVSAHTIKSYRDTLTLFLRYCRDEHGCALERFDLAQFTPSLVEAFVLYLEQHRGCGIRTRNQRLAALHAFARYLQSEQPACMVTCQRIIGIPLKRHAAPIMIYLTSDEMRALLAHPNLQTPMGRRDAVLLSLLYDSGARVQELIDLAVRDLRLEPPAQVRLTGKGRKTRVVPLMTHTVELLHAYLDERGLLQPGTRDQPVFINRRRTRFTRAGIAHLIEKYAALARAQGILLPDGVTPHTFRHTKAMHLLQAGVPLVIIRDFLGHADIKTSEVYARADLQMKREALEKLAPTVTPHGLPSWQTDAELLEWLRSL